MIVCHVVITTGPSSWYRRQYRILQRLFQLISIIRPLRKPRKVTAVYLNKMLALTTRMAVDFPIPVRLSGADRLREGEAHLICGTHLPLNKVGLTALARMGSPVHAAIAAEPDVDLQMAIWGTTQRIPALKADAHVLLKARRLFNQGFRLAAMIDRRRMELLSGNSLKLAALCGVESSLIRCFLADDATVMVELLPLPYPCAAEDPGLSANLEFIRQYHDLTVSAYDQPIVKPANSVKD